MEHLVHPTSEPWSIPDVCNAYSSLGSPNGSRPETEVMAGSQATPFLGGGLSDVLIQVKGCILIYANEGGLVAGSYRHPSPHFPAPVIHQWGLKDNTVFV